MTKKFPGRLCLTRKKDEQILIAVGDVMVEITTIETHTGHVKLGITAPPSVKILRKELAECEGD